MKSFLVHQFKPISPRSQELLNFRYSPNKLPVIEIVNSPLKRERPSRFVRGRCCCSCFAPWFIWKLGCFKLFLFFRFHFWPLFSAPFQPTDLSFFAVCFIYIPGKSIKDFTWLNFILFCFEEIWSVVPTLRNNKLIFQFSNLTWMMLHRSILQFWHDKTNRYPDK